MTDLPTGPPTRCAVPPPPPPPPQGWRDTELRQDALHLAVQSIEATSAIGGWVDEARTAVLDTAEVYLAWLRTGERGGRQVPVCEACRGSGYQLLNDRPTGNPCPACAGEATDA